MHEIQSVLGGIYHVYHYGHAREILFRSEQDFRQYLYYLSKYAKKFNFNICCYCLLGSSLHFCCEQKGNSNIEYFTKQLRASYEKYYNRKYRSKDKPLKMPSYKIREVTSNNYLAYLSFYIHTLPLHLGYKALQDYVHSSYREFFNCQENICGHALVLANFDDSYLEYFVYGQKYKEDRLNCLSSKIIRAKSPTNFPNPKPKIGLDYLG